jgi:hypothetical protein
MPKTTPDWVDAVKGLYARYAEVYTDQSQWSRASRFFHANATGTPNLTAEEVRHRIAARAAAHAVRALAAEGSEIEKDDAEDLLVFLVGSPDLARPTSRYQSFVLGYYRYQDQREEWQKVEKAVELLEFELGETTTQIEERLAA